MIVRTNFKVIFLGCIYGIFSLRLVWLTLYVYQILYFCHQLETRSLLNPEEVRSERHPPNDPTIASCAFLQGFNLKCNYLASEFQHRMSYQLDGKIKLIIQCLFWQIFHMLGPFFSDSHPPTGRGKELSPDNNSLLFLITPLWVTCHSSRPVYQLGRVTGGHDRLQLP